MWVSKRHHVHYYSMHYNLVCVTNKLYVKNIDKKSQSSKNIILYYVQADHIYILKNIFL